MISSLIDPEVENKLKSLLNDIFFPFKMLFNYNFVIISFIKL